MLTVQPLQHYLTKTSEKITKKKVPYFGTEGGAGEKELSKFCPHGETHF